MSRADITTTETKKKKKSTLPFPWSPPPQPSHRLITIITIPTSAHAISQPAHFLKIPVIFAFNLSASPLGLSLWPAAPSLLCSSPPGAWCSFPAPPRPTW